MFSAVQFVQAFWRSIGSLALLSRQMGWTYECTELKQYQDDQSGLVHKGLSVRHQCPSEASTLCTTSLVVSGLKHF